MQKEQIQQINQDVNEACDLNIQQHVCVKRWGDINLPSILSKQKWNISATAAVDFSKNLS